MGIEVWVRRVARGGGAAEAVVAPAATERAESIARDSPPAGAHSGPATTDASPDYRAELDCIATAGVVIVGRWHNALDKRLANDVALAIAIAHDPAMVQSTKVQQTTFKWPATQTGDRSIGAARNAFKAFLRGQAERAHARCVVLFGDVAGTLADDRDSAAPRIVRQPSIGALRADPNAKKALWLNVSQNVPG